MNFFIKKVIPLSLIITLFAFILFLLFPKKSTIRSLPVKGGVEQSETEGFNQIVTQNEQEGFKLIKTAFIEQSPEKNWDQPWQDACEEAALLTVDFYYKNKPTSPKIIRDKILNMIKFEETQNFTKDINIAQMAVVSEKYLNYQTKIIDNPTIEDIKKYLTQNIPIIVPASGKILYQENKHFNSGGPYYHNVVVLGYDDDKQQFIVHDVGTKSGSYFHYSYSLLLESIHDFPISGIKEDINNGQKRILILLK